jgi:hypothetical protein
VRHGIAIALLAALTLGGVGCGESDEALDAVTDGEASPLGPSGLANLEIGDEILDFRQEGTAGRQAFFGDLHVHTTYSFDAFAFGTIATPDDAYRFAKGEAILHLAGFEVRLPAPLYYYAFTDHALFLASRARPPTPRPRRRRSPVPKCCTT